MPKKEAVREYKVADADLKQECDALVLCMNRDLADFATRGVTPAAIAAFEQLINDFNAVPTDQELLGVVTTATEVKDALRTRVAAQVRSIRGMADDKYDGKGPYRRFGFESLDRLSDNELWRLGGRVARTGAQLQADLLGNGLTTAVLATLKTTVDDFDAAIDKQDDAINNRDILTQDRIVAGNTLHTQRSRLSNIGKSLYEDTDEARYNDYVMSDPPGAPPADTV